MINIQIDKIDINSHSCEGRNSLIWIIRFRNKCGMTAVKQFYNPDNYLLEAK